MFVQVVLRNRKDMPSRYQAIRWNTYLLVYYYVILFENNV